MTPGTDVAARPAPVAGEVVAVSDTRPRRSPWARQVPVTPPHPCATAAQNRPATVWDVWREDPGVRWLAYMVGAALLVQDRVPFWPVLYLGMVGVAVAKDWATEVPILFARLPAGGGTDEAGPEMVQEQPERVAEGVYRTTG